jgi:hypothetical protein
MADQDDADLPQEEAEEPQVRGPSLFTMSLILLNILAALGFAYLLVLDHDRRVTWSYGVFRHDLSLLGLPLEEEENHEGASSATRPPQRIDPDQLKKAFSKRRGTLSGSDKYQPVHEVVGLRVKPSQLTPAVLKDVFGGEPKVKTLQEEVDRVEKELLAKVEEAAKEALQTAKDDDAKRTKLGELLLPLATATWQIDLIDKLIAKQTTNTKSEELDQMVGEAAQRRMLVDLLRLLEEHRPTVPADESENQKKLAAERRALLDASADPSAVTLKQLQDQLKERFEEARNGGPGKLGKETYSKRENIAYLLYAISQMRKPANPADFLFPKGAERVQTVVGLYEFILAADALTRALVTAQERVLAAIAADRAGYPIQGTTRLEVVPGYVGRHQDLVKRIIDLVGVVSEEKARLVRLKEEEAKSKSQFELRTKDHDGVVEQLIKARHETALQVAELRRLEQQLFQAQVDLADAARTNEQLERDIRDAERKVGRKQQ